MKRALRDLIRSGSSSATRNTIQALCDRDLCQSDYTLTMRGRFTAITLLPLQEQCRLLNLRFDSIPVRQLESSPEVQAFELFRNRGYVGAYCEGRALLLLIRCAALNVLAKLNTFGSREDACMRFTEAQLTILVDHIDEILESIRCASEKSVVGSFREIYGSPLIREWHPGLTEEAVLAIYRVIGPIKLAEITQAIAEDPYTYRSGWPDLTLTNYSEIRWIEVKTTDRLHLSQIQTISRMKDIVPGTFEVVQLLTR